MSEVVCGDAIDVGWFSSGVRFSHAQQFRELARELAERDDALFSSVPIKIRLG